MSEGTTTRKSESVDERLAQDPTAQRVIDDLKKRTAILFRNADAVTAKVVEDERHRIEWRSNEKIGISTGVPIAEDGYFLTAAHSVGAPTSLRQRRRFTRQRCHATKEAQSAP